MRLSLLCLALFACASAAEEEAKKKPDTVIGIDLGTTYSCVGVMKDGRVEIIANDQGNRITPSYVAFTDDERLVGDAAKNQASLNPKNTVYDAKRLIGREYSDSTVQHDKSLFPFDVVDMDGKPGISVTQNGKAKTYAAEEISAMVLTKMKETAEAFLGKTVVNAVVTVPAYFNDAQRQATKDAGQIAGLNVLRIINEPTAAAIAYGLDKELNKDKSTASNIMVYDLGGGTFDVSILTLDDGVFEVLATNGDTHLGGEDFDNRVLQHFLKVIKSKHNLDLSKDNRALAKLRREVEKAKRGLSSVHSVKVEIESLIDGEDFSETLTRAKFEELNIDLFKKTMKPVSLVLKDAGLTKADIAEIVLVGGSTRITMVQSLLKSFFKGKEPNKGVNPDEAVAYGAAVQGGILSGEGGETTKDVLLLDVTPLSLGTSVDDGTMVTIIKRNTVIPAKKSDEFTTVHDNQATVLIEVYQGERAMAEDNVKLGSFDLEGIPPARRGVPQIKVTFEIDANGILQVNAFDKVTKKKQGISIKPEQGRLSEEEIARMVKEAEDFAEEDKAIKAKLASKSKLENYLYTIKGYLEDEKRAAKIGGKVKKELELALEGTLEFIENDVKEASKEDIDEEFAKLEKAAKPAISKMFGGKPPKVDPETGHSEL
jgi:heat shock protein 5